jgi:hypothetical protein
MTQRPTLKESVVSENISEPNGEQSAGENRRIRKSPKGRIWDWAIAGAVGGSVIGMVVGSFVGVTGHDPTGGLGGAFEGMALGMMICVGVGCSSRNPEN